MRGAERAPGLLCPSRFRAPVAEQNISGGGDTAWTPDADRGKAVRVKTRLLDDLGNVVRRK